MKILHIIANLSPRFGGPPKACLEMACAQAKRGYEVGICTTNQDGPGILPVPINQVVVESGVSIRYFQVQSPRKFCFSLPLMQYLRKYIKNYDVVHLHSVYLFPVAVAGCFCIKNKVPYVFTPHGALDPYIYNRHRYRKAIAGKLYHYDIIKNASVIHFITREERALAEKYCFGVPGCVVPIGLNVENYIYKSSQNGFLSRFPELNGKKIILFLGRINFKKGLDILVDAFAAVAEELKDVHLLLAGPDDDGYGKKVASFLKKRNISDKATLAGMLLGDEKLEALYSSSVFVLPSYSENFGISVLEAMACGLPVIVSDKVNLWPDIVEAGAGMVAPCDAFAFSRKMMDVLRDEELARRLGGNGSSLVRGKYSWEDIAARLLSVYSSLLKTPVA